MKLPLLVVALVYSAAALAAPTYVATFHSLGLYWTPPGGAPDKGVRVQFRAAGTTAWREGLALWFDPRNAEYRGSLVELEPGTAYTVRLTLDEGPSETIEASTWSEHFPVKRTVRVAAGTRQLVIEASDSGDEREGYVVFTGPPGGNVIDPGDLGGEARRESCVVLKQGVHHVIVRGLVLRNCRRHAILFERPAKPRPEAATRDIVIEDNDVSGWGGLEAAGPSNDSAIHCAYAADDPAAIKPARIVVQRNRIHDPRHGANPWQRAGGPRTHPQGPQAVNFRRCGANHVFRYNEISSQNGNFYNDAIGGSDNFSLEGFPWADSDLYGNRISDVYDDGIEAEGGNRNVRIWANYFDRVHVPIANAATALGPLYVWRNVSNRMANLNDPDIHPDLEARGPFIKAGSRNPAVNGGRAYYFHNTALQPPPAAGARFPLGAGGGIQKSGGVLYNFVSRNNIWHIHKTPAIHGQPKFQSIRADCDAGPCDADFDLYNGRLANAGRRGEAHGFSGTPIYATSGTSYPARAEQGDFSLAPRSPGYGSAERIPNFNDAYARPDVGAHQSGTPPMKFGLELKPPRAAWASRSRRVRRATRTAHRASTPPARARSAAGPIRAPRRRRGPRRRDRAAACAAAA